MAKKKSDRHKSKPFQLRMPDPLRRDLEQLAAKKYTTVTAEIIAAIRRYLQAKHSPGTEADDGDD